MGDCRTGRPNLRDSIMPTVKTREFKHTAKSGETMQFKAAITVDSHGEFAVNISEELAQSARALLKQPAWAGHVIVDKARVHWRVQGRVLGEVERFVEESMKEHLAVEEKRELVIRYRYQNHTSFARAADGGKHPNGHWAEKDGECDSTGRSWAWAGNPNICSNNRPTLFGVAVVARVYQKVSYLRPGSTKVIYTDELPGSHWDLNPMRRLNDFLVSEPDCRNDNGGFYGSKGSSGLLQEMPYSDAAATFFADLMIAMCNLGEQLDAFVGDREQLQLAIERGSSLLPAPEPGGSKPA